MLICRESQETFYRPKVRRLINLTNKELSLLIKKRAKDLVKFLDGHSWGENERVVYYHIGISLQDNLMECMMEIQSRYPESDIKRHYHGRLLPVMESKEIEL